MERRITECEGHLYHTCIHESELRDYRGEDGWFIRTICIAHSLWEDEGPRKTLKNVLLITERIQLCVCAAARGSLLQYFLTSVALRPPSFLIQLPLHIPADYDIILQQGALQPSGLLLLLSSPQDAAQRLDHISISQDSSSHILSLLLCSLNASLYLLTEQWCTPWYMSSP